MLSLVSGFTARFAARRSYRAIASVPVQSFNSFSLSGRKRSENDYIENIEDLIPKGDNGWVTIQLGSDDDVIRGEMLDRLQKAKQLESSQRKSRKSSDSIDIHKHDENELYLESDQRKRKPLQRDSRTNSKSLKHNVEDYMKGADESKKRITGYLELNPFVCSGCGSNFQSKTPDAPGFLPPDKFKEHRANAELIRKKQEAIRTLQMADLEFNSPAAEELLRAGEIEESIIASIKRMGDSLQASSKYAEGHNSVEQQLSLEQSSSAEAFLINDLNSSDDTNSFDLAANAILDRATIASMLSGRSRNNLAFKDSKIAPVRDAQSKLKPFHTQTDIDPDGQPIESVVKEFEEEVCICQRCYRLQQYGQVEQNLRPGWSKHEFLTPERFEHLLSSIKTNEAVVLCLVDIFDLQGSIVRNLRQIAGDNPVLIGVNKVDLLPKDISKVRIQQWVHEEIKRVCGFVGPKSRDDENFLSSSADNVLKMSNVHLISCKNDAGVRSLMNSALALAEENGRKIYVMGAANVGKSSFINRLLEPDQSNPSYHQSGKKKTPSVTVSNLPGTTLDFLKIKLPNSGVTVIDTPGLINRGHLTSKLTTDELKQVIPSKPINAVTFRIEEGKCALLGGFARVELMEVGWVTVTYL